MGSNSHTSPSPPPPPKSGPRTVSTTEINEFKDAVEKARKVLTNYYSGPKPMDETWGYPLNPEGFDFIGEKIARSIKYNRKFVVGVIGSSVAAGHDNCNYDSFERQLERFLKPVFEKIGVEFVVRNAGEGGSCGDNMENQIFCTRNMIGDDVDVAVYSWTYFEAGWFKSDQSRTGLKNIHEMFARWALKMERAPAPLFVNVGEDSKAWDGWDSLIKRYGKFGTNVIYIQKYLNSIGYKRKWSEVGDGMHETTREGETSNATRKKSLGVVFRNWHPGPLGFQLVSDSIAWLLTSSMLRGAEQLSSGAVISEKPHLMLESNLPKHECKDWHYDNNIKNKAFHTPKFCETEDPPSCVNFERPTYGYPQIKISTGDELNPWYGSYKEDHREILKPERELIPKEEREALECKHLDVCRGFTSDTFMTFRLPRIELGVIGVCCFAEGVKNCREAMAERLEFYLDKTKLKVNKDEGTGKCLTVQHEWSEVSDSGGHLYLGKIIAAIGSLLHNVHT